MIGRHGKPWLPVTRPCFFREPGQGRQSGQWTSSQQQSAEGDELLYCRQCLAPLTSKKERLQIQGKHCHVFANPEGLVFEIGCFGLAPGCFRQGRPTRQFSWFPPHAWRFALCRGCKSHVGWYYETTAQSAFYGLILDRLVEQAD